MNLDRLQIELLLTLHKKAYELLMWLNDQAASNPEILSPENVVIISDAAACVEWLGRNQHGIPTEMLPSDEHLPAFARLMASFFDVSFHVDHVHFEGRLLSARLKSSVIKKEEVGMNARRMQILALKHLASNVGVRISEKTAEALYHDKSIRDDLRIWTYIWELGRRAYGKSKGAGVHTLWRGMEASTRKTLDVEVVMAARQKLIDHIRRRRE